MDIRPINNRVQADVQTVKTNVSENHSGAATSAPAAARVETAQAVQPVGQTLSAEEMSEALKKINDAMKSMNVGVEFSIDDDTQKTVVKVVDTQTKDIIRQIPTVEMIEISKALDKVQGLLVRQEA